MAPSSAHSASDRPLSESPAAVIERGYDLLRRGAVDEWTAMWTDDIEIRQTTSVPWGGTYRGRAACLDFLQRAAEYIESVAGPDEPLYVCGDEVVAIGRSLGVARKTGEPFDIRIVHVWRIRGEQIAGWTLYVDTDQLGGALDGTKTSER